MDRGDPRQQPGVAEKRAKMVRRPDQRRAAFGPQHSGVIANAPKDLDPFRHDRIGGKRAERCAQRPVTDLGATAATEHAAERRLRHADRRAGRRFGRRHLRRLKLAHEAPVDPVLRAPQRALHEWRTIERKPAFLANRPALTERQQLEPGSLSKIGAHRAAGQRRLKIARQRRPLPHGENAGLGARRLDHCRGVSRREDLRMRRRPQLRRDGDKPGRVHRKTAILEKDRRPSPGGDKHDRRLVDGARRRDQPYALFATPGRDDVDACP